MRFAGQLTSGANLDRTPTRRRALDVALMALLTIAAADVGAESAVLFNPNSQSAASARLGITVVIPAVLFLDSRTGTFYTNDAKAVVTHGTSGVSRYTIGIDRTGQGRFQGRGAGGTSSPGHPFRDGEVVCIP